MISRFAPAGLAQALLCVVVFAGPVAAGDQAPFNGRMEGALTKRIPFPAPPVFLDTIEMTGNATQLGAFKLVATAVVDFGTAPPQAAGTAMFLAANGDTVTAEFHGTSELVEPGVVLITELAIITSGTGRFAGATGGFTVERLFNLTTSETVGDFMGTISVPAP